VPLVAPGPCRTILAGIAPDGVASVSGASFGNTRHTSIPEIPGRARPAISALSYLSFSRDMPRSVSVLALDTKSYQIPGRVIAEAAPQLNVMDLKALDLSARLATRKTSLRRERSLAGESAAHGFASLVCGFERCRRRLAFA
jgi:hypothetical protein